jgi:hypothetical protein
MQQIKFLRDQVMIFNMVYKLTLGLFKGDRVFTHLLDRGTEWGTLIVAYVILFDLISEAVVVDTITARLPLEIK